MLFNSNYAKDKNLYLTFISNPKKEKVISMDNNDPNIIFFNPNYILNAFHIIMAVNKGFYQIKLGKMKTKEYKKEIIHCSTNENKLSESLKVHSIENNNENNYFVVFIDYEKDQIKNKIEELEGNEINVDNYANFLNFDNLVKHFQINEKNEIDNIDNGIQKAIYNRIATKELK